ncbi:BNR-4 repeat-containing protein [Aeromicrobium camelliae]|uniref:BNR-4 repeat-containing protein n=1 Tax=Aeromicrobium camelliae TaxID=1538144 RepID=UPI001FB59E7A|nr:BNR-4 repeat-containing protein [Aeromicrobium camelliae]
MGSRTAACSSSTASAAQAPATSCSTGTTPRTGRWTRVHDRLLDGEGQRNPYWQATVDSKGRLHLAWTWRRTGDVRTNHDVSYARSIDGSGVEWERSDGRRYAMPVTRADAELLAAVPENSNLINQTSIAVDEEDQPVIATYWSDGQARSGVKRPVQYRIIEQAPEGHCNDGRTPAGWCIDDTGFLSRTSFELGGFGTLAIPISRPQVLAQGSGANRVVHLVFRAQERGQKVSIATRRGLGAAWDPPIDLTHDSVEDWEPSYDTEQWRRTRVLDLYVQRVNQVNNEGIASTAPQRVYVLSYPLASARPTTIEEPQLDGTE